MRFSNFLCGNAAPLRPLSACAGLLVAALVMFAQPPEPAAHPHVWVKIQTQVLYDASGKVTGVRHAWTFDEIYSAFATQGLDANGNGKMDPAELTELASENIASLEDFEYFTFVETDGDAVKDLQPADAKLVHVEDVLTLHFTLRLKKPVDPQRIKLDVAVYDPTYFVAFAFDEDNPVMLAAGAPKTCRADFKRPQLAEAKLSELGEAFYSSLDATSDFGAQFAQSFTVACGAR